MAESGDGQERSEEPTGKRLQDARDKGQVPRSRELTTVASLVGGAMMMMAMGGNIMADLTDMMRRGFTIHRDQLSDVANLPAYFLGAVIDALWAIAPLVLLLMVIAVLSNTMLSGWNFTAQALQIKLNKLDPVSGLKRIFGWRGFVELAKSFAKFLLVGGVGVLVIYWESDALYGLGAEPLEQALGHTGELLLWAFLLISSALVVVALIDVPFQMWDHKRQLKMTKQEVKEEHKQAEGSPQVKQRQRNIQFQMAQRRMMQEVPKADVVVTNPTHYSVALRYDQSGMDAPIVVAKGVDLMATQIRTIARENGVPVLEAPPLARALYHSTEVDQPIPAGLYRAVAQVLAYVYHLRQGTVYNRDGKAPDLNDLPIPDDLRR